MSFTPLPEILLEKCADLAGRGRGVALDLGCGEGSLGTALGDLGVRPWGLDRTRPGLGSAADIVADLRHPPLRPGCADLVVAGNVLRHLLAADRSAAFLTRWGGLLKSGGSLVLLEDQPDRNPGPARNYAEVQDFLVTVTGGRRGRLLPLAEFRKTAATILPKGVWQSGLKANRWPVDAANVLTMLRGGGGEPGPEAARLMAAITAEGLAYGKYWWACWVKK